MKSIFFYFISILVFLFLGTHTTYSQAFRTTWITTDTQITIPTNDSLEYNYSITWKNLTNKGVGDGSIENQKGNYTIKNLEDSSIYEIAITGDFPHFYMNLDVEEEDPYAGTKKSTKESSKLQTIEEWGEIKWQSMAHAFDGCINMSYKATDIPNLTEVKDMSYMFSHVSGLKVSEDPLMYSMLVRYSNFEGNATMTNWNTSNVTDMSYMFDGASIFNQPLDKWDTQNVTNMSKMFAETDSFNQPLDKWDTQNVTNMNGMFATARSFNQPIGNWNTSKVTNMSKMFWHAKAFNQPVGEWNISNVATMANMFEQSHLSKENYDATLLGWVTIKEGEKIPREINIDSRGLRYCKSEEARQKLINEYGWVIEGDELNCK